MSTRCTGGGSHPQGCGAYGEARQHLDALAQKVFERALLDEDDMPHEAPYLDAVEACVKHHLNALAKDNYRRSLDRTSASSDGG